MTIFLWSCDVYFSAESIVQNESLDREGSEEDGVEQEVAVRKEVTHAEESLIWTEACYTALERHADNATVQVRRSWPSLLCRKDLNFIFLICTMSLSV